MDGERRGIHICSGNLRGRPLAGNLRSQPWADMLQRLDGVVDVAHLALQYFNRYLERDLFRALPRQHGARRRDRRRGVLLGRAGRQDPRARAGLGRVVGEDRLWLTLSCGFGRHPARGVPVLREKVENMVEAAATL